MKIDIIGSVASGKTTLARELSNRYHIPYYEKDNIVWERTENGDRKRTDAERDALFHEILSGQDWIVEGSPRKSLHESFELSDYIIMLDVKLPVRLYRVARRWRRQRRKLESYNSEPAWKFLWSNVCWVFEFTRDRKRVLKELSRYGDKLKIFSGSGEALDFIEKVI